MANASKSAPIASRLKRNVQSLMPKLHETPSPARGEILDIKTLSAQDKVRRLLEIFDLGKDKAGNETRKQKFLDLISRYYEVSVKAKARNVNELEAKTSDDYKAALHNEIMEIIRNFSLSQGISKNQEMLTEYLSRDRKNVADMIWSYFTHSATTFRPTDPVEHTLLHQARRGDAWFGSVPASKEDE